MLEYFLENVNQLDPYSANYSFIHAACFGNDLEMVQYLVDERKIDLNYTSQSINEITPLRWAAKVFFKFR